MFCCDTLLVVLLVVLLLMPIDIIGRNQGNGNNVPSAARGGNYSFGTRIMGGREATSYP